MMQLRMTPKYIDWTFRGLKRGTTRDHPKIATKYELITGSYYKPLASGVIIQVGEPIPFTFGALNEDLARQILKAECFETLEEFKKVLLDIMNWKTTDRLKAQEMPADKKWWFHPFDVIAKPKKLELKSA